MYFLSQIRFYVRQTIDTRNSQHTREKRHRGRYYSYIYTPCSYI